eukprot:4750877-Alexandrium_andersonii.AAC.1
MSPEGSSQSSPQDSGMRGGAARPAPSEDRPTRPPPAPPGDPHPCCERRRAGPTAEPPTRGATRPP